jgi:hypothetical protein
MTDHKCDDDVTEGLRVTDIDTIIKIKNTARTLGTNA